MLLLAGGAGGKGTWGALGSELAEEEVDGAIDSNDPNYDEANPENREFKIKVINLDRSNEELQVSPLSWHQNPTVFSHLVLKCKGTAVISFITTDFSQSFCI